MIIIWCIVPEIWNVTGRNFLSFWVIFCPFTPLKNKDFDKMKKPPWNIIILHKCTKNHNHVLHCFWDMAAHDGCNFYFSFWAIFCTSTPLTAWKSKLKKKKNWKNAWRYHHFTQPMYQKLWSHNTGFLRTGVW